MQTFDQSLFYLYQSGLISLDEALRGSTNPDEFRLRLAGIQNTSAIAKEEMEKIGPQMEKELRPWEPGRLVKLRPGHSDA